MNEDKIYKKAKKRVKAKKAFYDHLMVYLITNIVMFLVVFLNGGGFAWLIPAGFWGISLVIQYLEVFGFPGNGKIGSKEWETRQIQKEMEKLGGTSEDIPDDALELKELERSRKSWDDSDLV